MSDAITNAAVDGWYGRNQPAYDSSPMGLAWSVGNHLRITGQEPPKSAVMSRGYRVRIDHVCVYLVDNGTVRREQ